MIYYIGIVIINLFCFPNDYYSRAIVVVEKKLYMEKVELQKPADYSKAIVFKNLFIIPGPLLKRKLVQVAPRPGNNWSAAWNDVTCSLICICACLHLDLYSYLCIQITLFKCVCGEHEKRKHICVTKR